MNQNTINHYSTATINQIVYSIIKATTPPLLTAPVIVSRTTLDLLGKGLTFTPHIRQEQKFKNFKAHWIIRKEDQNSPKLNDKSNPVILYLHGGAYRFGSTDSHLPLLVDFAKTTGYRVFAPEYRLAPENPYPAALEDAVNAYQFLLKEGYKNIIISGDSAGGNLTLVLLLHLKKNQLPQPKCAVVISPWTNIGAGITGSRLEKEKVDPMLSNKLLDISARDYALGEPLDHEFLSPLFGDFKDICPIQIHVGDREILLDDSIQLQEKLSKGEHDSELHIWNGLFHDFVLFGPFIKEAKDCMLIMTSWMQKYLSNG